jgi:predicted lipoprotein
MTSALIAADRGVPRRAAAWLAAAARTACCGLALGGPLASCHEGPRDENVRPNMPAAPTGMTPLPGASDAAQPGAPTDAGASPGRDGGNGQGGAGPQGGESGGGVDPGIADAGVLPTPTFTKRRLLEAAAQCAVGHYQDFEAKAAALVTALEALAEAPQAAERTSARAAFAEAMASWQRAELFRFGPAARAPNPGALELRDQIYAFPLRNACLVDRQLVSGLYEDGNAFAASAISARGLSALEYLLFYEGDANACAPSIDINANGTWAALDGEERAQRRADYALAAARDVLARARSLVDAWAETGGNFMEQFVQAGESGSVYPLDQAALNALNDALFYVENEVKDFKLGVPLGISVDCVNAPSACPDQTESRYVQASADHLRQNLLAARRLFQGCGAGNSGIGFDDWLEAVGASALSEDMLAALSGAQAAVDDLPAPLEPLIVSAPAEVQAVHAAVKRFTDLLKTTFVSVLDLELPQAAEGDND